MKDLAEKLEYLINESFKGVRVIECCNPDDVSNTFDAFFVPDGKSGEFMSFLIEDFWKVTKKAALPNCILIPHSVADTLEYYPEILSKAQEEMHDPSKEWLFKADDIEDSCKSVSVGGLFNAGRCFVPHYVSTMEEYPDRPFKYDEPSSFSALERSILRASRNRLWTKPEIGAWSDKEYEKAIENLIEKGLLREFEL